MTTMMALTTLFSSHTYTHTLSLSFSRAHSYLQDNHTSVVGMRESIGARGIAIQCVQAESIHAIMNDTVLCVVHEDDSKRFDTTTFLRVISMELNIRFHGRPALATDL